MPSPSVGPEQPVKAQPQQRRKSPLNRYLSGCGEPLTVLMLGVTSTVVTILLFAFFVEGLKPYPFYVVWAGAAAIIYGIDVALRAWCRGSSWYQDNPYQEWRNRPSTPAGYTLTFLVVAILVGLIYYNWENIDIGIGLSNLWDNLTSSSAVVDTVPDLKEITENGGPEAGPTNLELSVNLGKLSDIVMAEASLDVARRTNERLTTNEALLKLADMVLTTDAQKKLFGDYLVGTEATVEINSGKAQTPPKLVKEFKAKYSVNQQYLEKYREIFIGNCPHNSGTSVADRYGSLWCEHVQKGLDSNEPLSVQKRDALGAMLPIIGNHFKHNL